MIQNTSAIPEVKAGFHLLEIENIELVTGPSFEDPAVAEDRLKVHLRVRTPGAEAESFSVLMSPKLSERSTLGGIVRAIFGSPPPNGTFDCDLLTGHQFRHMISHSEKGWPRLVAGTAAPAGQLSA